MDSRKTGYKEYNEGLMNNPSGRTIPQPGCTNDQYGGGGKKYGGQYESSTSGGKKDAQHKKGKY